MNRAQEYSRVQGLRPGRSVFDLSYAKKFSGKMGYLYPVMCDEVVPGDVFDIAASAVVRFAPMVAPVLHEIIMKCDWFFVPYRILYNRSDAADNGATLWEQFITGGMSGAQTVTRHDLGILDLTSAAVPEGGLWDFLGVPPGITVDTHGDDSPLMFPGYAYYCIYNNYYRDPNFESELAFSSCISASTLAYANWDPDYFTRAMPYQQRGTAPAMPITGTSSAIWSAGDFVDQAEDIGVGVKDVSGDDKFAGGIVAGSGDRIRHVLGLNTVDLSTAVSFSVSDLRLAVQVQRWLERNERSGYRYTEFLRAHFGVSPRDDRLDRPEYIGGLRQPIVVSEVLQTSKTETGAPQGNLAGHGIMAGNHRIGKYHVKEYGLIMAIMSIVPRPAYQQGIDRQWLRVSRYDFYHPEFANLSEQAVAKEEIYFDATHAANVAIFGYQGRYDEMRSKRDMVHGAFRDSLDYWHLGRQFASSPSLGTTFGHTDPNTLTRIFAVPAADHLYVHWGNIIRAIRPLPLQSNPGLMDHDFGGR